MQEKRGSTMPVTDFPSVLEIKDPLHGYISLSEIERSLIDLRMSQRLRYIRSPAGIHLVFPGADSSQMGRMPGKLKITIFNFRMTGPLFIKQKRLFYGQICV